MHQRSPHQLAVGATVHCLTGCGIGEVAGMVLGTSLGWSNPTTIVVAVILAFAFGYTLTLIPLRGRGHALVHAFHGNPARRDRNP